MPIRVKCNCGKALNIPDSAVGKTVKCPGCSKLLKVPGGGSAPSAPAPSPKPAAPVAAASPFNEIDDLFAEEGMDQVVEAVCPACRATMKADAVLCVKCGYHKESGTRFEGHKTAGVDIDHGTLALRKAADDMAKAKQMQDKMISGAGMPWWALALVLFLIGSGLTIAVLAVNASRRVDESVTFNPMGLFLLLAGIAFGLVALGAYWMILVHGVKNTGKMGFLVLIPPYAIYYVFMNARETWKYLATVVVMGTICGVLLAQAAARGI